MNMNTYSQYFMVTSCSRHISIINIISDMKIQPSYVNIPAEQWEIVILTNVCLLSGAKNRWVAFVHSWSPAFLPQDIFHSKNYFDISLVCWLHWHEKMFYPYAHITQDRLSNITWNFDSGYFWLTQLYIRVHKILLGNPHILWNLPTLIQNIIIFKIESTSYIWDLWWKAL